MRQTRLSLPFCAALLVVFSFSAAFGQDPTKVEPAHYKLAFENENVQVVNVHYGPHEKSGLHAHPGGVVVVLTEAHLRFIDEHGKSQEVYAKPGEARWFPPFKHRVENLGESVYNAVYVGIKTHGSASAKWRVQPPQMDEPMQKLVAAALLAAAR